MGDTQFNLKQEEFIGNPGLGQVNMPTLQEEANHIMQEEYRNQHFISHPTFKRRLKKAGEEGLLIFTKYALVLVLAFLAIQYATSLISGANNGTNSAIYLNELQNKGWLPKVVNGQVPENEDAKIIK